MTLVDCQRRRQRRADVAGAKTRHVGDRRHTHRWADGRPRVLGRRSPKQGLSPSGTRNIRLQFTSKRGSGSYTDANVDDVSLVVAISTAPPITPTRTSTSTPRPAVWTVVSGKVVDATNGRAISGARVCMSAPTVCVTSNASGAYAFLRVSRATKTITASATGYISSSDVVITGDAPSITLVISLSKPLAAGGIRVVLSSDVNPRDIDSHLWLPLVGGSRQMIYYNQKGNCSTSPFACLDIDDR
ncbi:MAG: hypothetical protein RLZZ297_2101 [Chloroflexota bacterium]